MSRHKKGESALPILAIIFLATAAQIFILRAYHPLWWDQSVYAGMGKFIFSAGTKGIWEPLRPPLLPLLIGFFWKIGIDPVLAGKILSTLFNAGVIALVYFIAKKAFNYRTAVIASFLTAFSHLFLFYNHVGLSEIPSAFFALLAVLMIIERKYFWAGMFSSFSFLSKFPGGIIFGSAAIFIAFCQKPPVRDRWHAGICANIGKWFLTLEIPRIMTAVFEHNSLFQSEKIKEKAKRILLLSIGFFIPVAIFLIVNIIMYGNALLPFVEANEAIANTFPKSPFWFYAKEIIVQGVVCAFALVYAAIAVFRMERNRQARLLWIALVLFLAYFSWSGYKEMRFAMLFMPIVYILSAAGIFEAFRNFRKRGALMIIAVLLIFSIQSAYQLASYQRRWEGASYDAAMNKFYASVSGKSGEIWVSRPQFSEYTDARLNLIYYPTFEESSITILERMKNASTVFIDTCDLSCITEECKKRNAEMISGLESSFNKKEENSSSCRLLSFSR
ncbi:MAG: glycosyltransferase family 39 protein [Candidatus Woesearchaeota archaeon]|nr:glycosyltransferase family 39 protein [Candidatus Woesearchaeota archaeon]